MRSKASPGVPIAEALRSLEQLRGGGEMLELVDGRCTTRRHRAIERETVGLMRSLATEPVQPIERAGGRARGRQRYGSGSG